MHSTGASSGTSAQAAPAPVVISDPPTRVIEVVPGGLQIRAARLQGQHSTRAWTTRPVKLPDDVDPASFRVLAAVALEWYVDLVVGFTDPDNIVDITERWRVEPHGLRARSRLLVDGRALPRIDEARSRAWDGDVHKGARGRCRPCDFELRHVGETEIVTFELVTDALYFNVEELHSHETEARSYDVFLSYKSTDTEEFASVLNEKLRDLGLHTWFGPKQARVNFRDDIKLGIERSQHFVVIYSKHSYAQLPDQGRRRAFQKNLPDEREMNQEEEIRLILDNMTARREALQRGKSMDASEKRLYLIDYGDDDAGRPIPQDLHESRWHRHDRQNIAVEVGGRTDSDRALAAECARQIKAMVANTSGGRR